MALLYVPGSPRLCLMPVSPLSLTLVAKMRDAVNAGLGPVPTSDDERRRESSLVSLQGSFKKPSRASSPRVGASKVVPEDAVDDIDEDDSLSA